MCDRCMADAEEKAGWEAHRDMLRGIFLDPAVRLMYDDLEPFIHGAFHEGALVARSILVPLLSKTHDTYERALTHYKAEADKAYLQGRADAYRALGRSAPPYGHA